MFKIPQKIRSVLTKLNQNGFEAYIVGGCVRDLLMGITPHDYDITTSAKPHEVEALFEKSIPTGIEHGTVTVLIGNEPVEITTFRADGEYSDHRHPESVEYVTDVECDLARRDFTVNAIAYNEEKGIIDLFGGIDDINNKTLRAVGEPDKRFREDALRIMRLFRFSSVLGFSIEENTLLSALKNADLLQNVSVERINSELIKLLCGKNPQSIDYLLNCGALSFLGIREAHKTQRISLLSDNISLRLFALLGIDGGKALDKLKCSNKIKEDFTVFKKLSLYNSFTRVDIKEMLNIADGKLTADYLKYLSVFCDIDTLSATDTLNEIIAQNEPYKISHLNVNGNDLSSLGIKGEAIGRTLELLRKKVIAEPYLNTKEKLLNLAQKS